MENFEESSKFHYVKRLVNEEANLQQLLKYCKDKWSFGMIDPDNDTPGINYIKIDNSDITDLFKTCIEDRIKEIHNIINK